MSACIALKKRIPPLNTNMQIGSFQQGLIFRWIVLTSTIGVDNHISRPFASLLCHLQYVTSKL